MMLYAWQTLPNLAVFIYLAAVLCTRSLSRIAIFLMYSLLVYVVIVSHHIFIHLLFCMLYMPMPTVRWGPLLHKRQSMVHVSKVYLFLWVSYCPWNIGLCKHWVSVLRNKSVLLEIKTEYFKCPSHQSTSWMFYNVAMIFSSCSYVLHDITIWPTLLCLIVSAHHTDKIIIWRPTMFKS